MRLASLPPATTLQYIREVTFVLYLDSIQMTKPHIFQLPRRSLCTEFPNGLKLKAGGSLLLKIHPLGVSASYVDRSLSLMSARNCASIRDK